MGELVEAIAVCKIRGVGLATQLCFKLAEGDERILMQKMARDRLKQAQDDMGSGPSGWFELAADLMGEAPRRREAMKALQLAFAIKTHSQTPSKRYQHGVAGVEAETDATQAARQHEMKAALVAAWTDSWKEVYALANAICDRHIAEVTHRESAKLDAEKDWVMLATQKAHAMRGRL